MKPFIKNLLISSLTFAGLFLLGVYVSRLNLSLQKSEQDLLMSDIVNSQASALERRISRSLATTYILAQEVKRNNGEFIDFEAYADEVLKAIGGVSNLQLAPNGVITKIHPLKGNEKAIGHNILQDDRRRNEAILAVKEKHLTLAGPFSLVQGGEAIIGRNPVFLRRQGKEYFWGFASALIFLDDLLSVSDLEQLESKGYSYQLSRKHPDTGEVNIFARSDADMSDELFKVDVNVPNATWMLELSRNESLSPVAGYSVSFLVSLLLSGFFFYMLQQPEKLRLIVREKTTELERLAFHDELTGLPNRRLLNEQLEQEIRDLLRYNKRGALFYLDLDDFKRINDSMSHEAGDQLLKTIAQRLRNSLRKNDIVARLGGDEFAALLLDIDSVGHVQKIAEKLIHSITQPVILGKREVVVSATIGITLIPDDGREAGSIQCNADLAMYSAKKRGKKRFQFFNAAMQEKANQNLMLELDLRNALKEEQFSLQYQPLVCLSEHRIVGYEALIRWRHPERGILLPGQFIPIAEESNIIVPIGHWTLLEVCKLIQQRADGGLEPIYISVNLGPKQFLDPRFCSYLKETLSETGVSPELLELEITETTLIEDFEMTLTVLNELKSMGISIAIDDFGTGYSSLALLKQLPVDTLKIDRGFIMGIGSGKDERLVEAMTAMAGKLKLKLVAEGIENIEQLEFLESIRCDYGQGYLFGPPLPVNDMHSQQVQLEQNWPSMHNQAFKVLENLNE